MRVIIVGAGEVGYHTASWLVRENLDVIVIDSDAERIKKLRETLDVRAVHGEGSNPEVLEQAGAMGADMLVAVTSMDEVNMISCMLAGVQFGIPTKIARIRNPAYTKHSAFLGKDHLGIDFTITPETEVAEKILGLLKVPAATDLIEFADGKVQLIGLKIAHDSPIRDLKLRELPPSVKEGRYLVVAILRNERVLVPGGDDRILADDLIYVVARTGEYRQLFEFLKLPVGSVNKVMIMGGGRIGLNLAQGLEKADVSVKVIEISEERCNELTGQLNKTVILHGDAREVSLLQEENIANADVFIAVSNDEEDNMLISLLARRLGARKVISLVNRSEYIPIAASIGIDTAISPRITTAGAILRFIRKGKVLSVNTLKEEEAEALEVQALPTSAIVNKPIRKIKFPKDVIIGAVVRSGEVIIPGGDDIILPDDKVVIFTLAKSVKKVEKALAVKLEFF